MEKESITRKTRDELLDLVNEVIEATELDGTDTGAAYEKVLEKIVARLDSLWLGVEIKPRDRRDDDEDVG